MTAAIIAALVILYLLILTHSLTLRIQDLESGRGSQQRIDDRQHQWNSTAESILRSLAHGK